MRFAPTTDDAEEYDTVGANRIRPKNCEIAIQNRNNASQYIADFIVIEKIYEETNSKLRIGI